ncbi:hypothetical protein LYNGBM3L_20890 [Moorena producens 3L]|uniref:Uncharacterized protein n=1 Tax=Moorena producens 3L TaxID=489825 RepID=F4XN13_9CYAN|nr:hypothetical protein LYNGBM3L_20890 [Moorena producens 3L]OLT65052.1 hypothetical protein BI334_08410 [Moorena producens 3L]
MHPDDQESLKTALLFFLGKGIDAGYLKSCVYSFKNNAKQKTQNKQRKINNAKLANAIAYSVYIAVARVIRT